MRKRLIAAIPTVPLVDRDWLDLDQIAVVEITSEDVGHPIESALRLGEERGWRAAGAARTCSYQNRLPLSQFLSSGRTRF